MRSGRLKRIFELSVSLVLLVCAAVVCVAFFEVWVAPDVILALESFHWMGQSVWTIAFLSAIALLVILWLTVAFSVLALVSAMCVATALILIFSGFSLIWPLLLLLLAAWGVGRASQID